MATLPRIIFKNLESVLDYLELGLDLLKSSLDCQDDLDSCLEI